jgi:hypothetical protein
MVDNVDANHVRSKKTKIVAALFWLMLKKTSRNTVLADLCERKILFRLKKTN